MSQETVGVIPTIEAEAHAPAGQTATSSSCRSSSSARRTALPDHPESGPGLLAVAADEDCANGACPIR